MKIGHLFGIAFSDPDGNEWWSRPACPDGSTASSRPSPRPPALSLRRAEAGHGERDENWPDWYARYMIAEQAGTPLPS